jgi:DNA-binding XRE family transcriptional regulator
LRLYQLGKKTMKINVGLVIKLRKENLWSQEELAIAAGLNLRTIQRIEKEASASLQSKKALASVFDISFHALNYKEIQMKPCSICKSDDIYEHKGDFEFTGLSGELLPNLGKNMLSSTKIRPTVCANCGHVQVFASQDARTKMKNSTKWKKV